MAKKKTEYKLPTKPVLYIAYGSIINLPQMEFRCPHSEVVGTATVKDWELEFRGVATLVPKKGAEVPVLLWMLDPRDLPALNRYERFIGIADRSQLPKWAERRLDILEKPKMKVRIFQLKDSSENLFMNYDHAKASFRTLGTADAGGRYADPSAV